MGMDMKKLWEENQSIKEKLIWVEEGKRKSTDDNNEGGREERYKDRLYSVKTYPLMYVQFGLFNWLICLNLSVKGRSYCFNQLI